MNTVPKILDKIGLVLGIALLTASALSSQTGSFPKTKPCEAVQEMRTCKLFRTLDLNNDSANEQLNWMLSPINPGSGVVDSLSMNILSAEKDIFNKHYTYSEPSYKNTPDPPVITKLFLAQPASPQYTPNDNSLAANNGKHIISCINSSFYIYDTSGFNLKKGSFTSLASNPLLAGSFFYDPHVVYDPVNDRFVMVVLYGQEPSNTHLIYCVSATNDPTGAWRTYLFDGGFGNSNVWIDYPQLAVSNGEVFVTGNMFDANNSFQYSIILQINKSEGLSGAALNYKLWSGIKGNPFSLIPAPAYATAQMDNAMRFVCNDASGGSKVYIYTITGSLGSQPALLNTEIKLSNYRMPADAAQKGNADLLDQGGCRIRNAYLKDGLIHAVFAKSSSKGFGSIVYIRMDMDNYMYATSELNEDGLDFAFPSVAPASNKINNRLAYIYFLTSGKDRYPESRIALCDQSMNFSTHQLVKAGDNFIDVLTGRERWGDYTSIVKTYRTNQVQIWTAGSFGSLNARPGNVVSYYRLDEDSDYAFATKQQIDIFPNPADIFIHIRYQMPVSVDFKLHIVGMDGVMFREIKHIRELRSFNQEDIYDISLFSPGVYEFVFISEDNSILDRKKIVIVPVK